MPFQASRFFLALCALLTILALQPAGSWAQDSFGGGGGMGAGSIGGGALGGPIPQMVDLSAEVRLLRRTHASIAEETVKSVKPVAPPPANLDVPESALAASLGKRADFDFTDEPLASVVDYLRDALAFRNIVIDEQALEDEAIDASSDGVTFQAKGMSYNAALRHILRPWNLAAVRDAETLRITTLEVADETLRTRVYPVWDLVQAEAGGDPNLADYDTLIELITSSVNPDVWDDVGGPATINAYKGLLTVSTTDEAHQGLTGLLAALRRFHDIGTKTQPSVAIVDAVPDRLQEAAQAFLAKRIDLEFDRAPLNEVLETLASEAPISILLDQRALEDEGLAGDEEVSVSLKDVPLSDGLSWMLKPLGLTTVLEDEAILVTSRERAEETLRTRIYDATAIIDVADHRDVAQVGGELAELGELLEGTVAMESWDNVGGPAALALYAPRGVLVISQTDAAHRQIETLLASLEKARQAPGAAPKATPALASELVVHSYPLASGFTEEKTQSQLIAFLDGLLQGSDNQVNVGREFQIAPMPGRLVISHRRDAQRVLERVLAKLEALRPMPHHPGGLF